MVCSKASTSVIDNIISVCGFSDDSNMVKFIRNKGWTDLSDISKLSLDDTNDFEMVSYKDQPLAHHARRFRGFLLYYRRKSRELSSDLDIADIMMMTKMEFMNYCGSQDYHTDMQLSGYKKRAPKLVTDDGPMAQEFIPTAPVLVVVDDEIMAPSAEKHSSKHLVDKVFIQSHSDTTNLVDDLVAGCRLTDPATMSNHLEIWGADVGNDYLKNKTKKKSCIIPVPAFDINNAPSYANLASEVDWDPGSYHNMIDDIYKFYGVKEVDNIREWGAMDKLNSDQDDGEDQEMMDE
jgi:hypothetical protein